MQSWQDKFNAEIDEAITQLKVAKLNYENGKTVELTNALVYAKRHINKSKDYIPD